MPVSGQDGVTFNNFTSSQTVQQGPVFAGGQGAASADPHMRLTGAAADEATSPASPALDALVSQNFTVQVRVQLDDWTPSSTQQLIGPFTSVANGTWRFSIAANGFPAFATTSNGSTTSTGQSTVAVPVVDGTTVWVRAVIVSASAVANFSWAPDDPNPPTVWTTLSSNRAISAAPLMTSVAPVEVGSGFGGTTNALSGRIYRARILDATAALVAEFNAADWPASSPWISSGSGEAWSLQGGATVVSNIPIGTLAFTEDDDVIAMSGAENIPGTITWTEDDDTFAFTGAEAISGTASWSEDDDVLAFSGTETFTGTSSWTEDDDTIAATGTETFTGTAAWTEDDDVWLASGGITLTGTLAFTEDDDTLAFVGTETFTGTASWTEADDVLAFAGTSEIPGPITIGETFHYREPGHQAWAEPGHGSYREPAHEGYTEPRRLTAKEPATIVWRDR